MFINKTEKKINIIKKMNNYGLILEILINPEILTWEYSINSDTLLVFALQFI